MDASNWTPAEIDARFRDMEREMRRASPWWLLRCRLIAARNWLRSSASLCAALGCLSAMSGGPYPPPQPADSPRPAE